MELHKKRKKAKILEALERGSTLMAQRLVTKYNSVLARRRYWLNDLSRSTTPVAARTGKAAITDLLAYWPVAILLSLYFTPFPCFLFLLAWLKLI